MAKNMKIFKVGNNGHLNFKSGNGFSLIEVLIAIALFGGAIVCLLTFFSFMLTESTKIKNIENISNLESKINIFLNNHSFDYIRAMAVNKEIMQLVNDDNKITFRVKLNEYTDENINKINSIKSYLIIAVEILKNNNDKQILYSFTTIKNR